MEEFDFLLLEKYMDGFEDELDNKPTIIEENELLMNAYNLGRKDAIIGDDIPNFDNQTEEELLQRIKNIK